MSIKNKLIDLYSYLHGDVIEEIGRQQGQEKAKCEIEKEKLGSLMMSELQRVKENAGDGCPKCKRTQRKYCRKHQRMLLGLDHLAGRIAKLYLEKESKWKEDSEENN